MKEIMSILKWMNCVLGWQRCCLDLPPLHSLSEVKIYAKLLSIHSTSIAKKSLEHCGQQMPSCMVVKKHMRNLNEHVARERNFREFRIACESSEAWLGFLDACNVDQCFATSCYLQHILQHFWTKAVHSNGAIVAKRLLDSY